MKATARIVNPDGAELTLELTMTVKEWKELEQLLPTRWPGAPVAVLVGRAIRGTIEHVETALDLRA